MGEFFKKALARGLTPGNIASWCSLEAMRRFGAFFGTLRLRVKARLLGVKLGMGVKGIWLAMLIDWTARAVLFPIRFHGSAWLRHQPLKDS